MKRVLAILLAAVLAASLCACGTSPSSTETNSAAETAAPSSSSETAAAETESSGSTVQAAEAVTDESVSASEAAEAFTITSDDGDFTNSGSIYTISSAGTYSLQGLLEGQILVDAGEDDDVVLELNGVTISYGEDSPIKIISAGSVDISAKSGTENVINDNRSAETANDDSQGSGAIYAKCNLKLKGTGTLVINASYNNGVHTTKDLTIQKLALKVNAYNNALKGNDSVTILSGTVVAISTNGDGVKTENTDTDKNGETRGDIVISGGSVTVYAAGDAFQAAHDFELTVGEDGMVPSLVIYTGSFSGYTASNASTSSYKGIKVQNELRILDGAVTIQSYDDGLHADYGASLDDGSTGQGTISISGGTVTISVYSPETQTAGGQMGPGGMGGQMGPGGMGGQQPGGWSGQQTVSGADGIHADYILNISGGTVNIDSAYEGLEANIINISGGTITVSANDDGMNACSGNKTPQINISGGYVEVSVSTSGDTDGIDSNGTYTQTGGIVIVKGPNNQNMAALDADGTASITGGTLILLGYGSVSTGGSVKSYSLSLHSAGSHTVMIDGVSYTFTNAESYGRTTVYSDVSVSS